MNKLLYENGIDILTGEACSISMRILCDLNPEGIKIIERFFGGTIKCVEGSNWNNKGTASIMLSYSCIKDLEKFIRLTVVGEKNDRNVHQMSGRET